MLEKKYKTIKWILGQQIERGTNYKWGWKQAVKDEEFVCVYNIIPKWSTELYTAQQLLNKLNNE
tara:strand:- start:841 stop:1032 length:192 start_codon:yes stop_codon:yes gene_type:complete